MTKRKAFDKVQGEFEIQIPTLQVVRDEIIKLNFPKEGMKITEVRDQLCQKLQLTEEIRKAKNKFGQGVFYLNVLRSVNFLVGHGVLKRINEMVCRIEEQQDTLISNDSFPTEEEINPPDEYIERNYQELRSELANELLQQILGNSPNFFENLVIDLLVKMGYGFREDAGRAVGRSGDGGIDGIIYEDRLELDGVYIQAKRWDKGKVGSPAITAFVGALDINNANKGVFISTSKFTEPARKCAENCPKNIKLIDGDDLVNYMIEFNLGVSTVDTYEIKRVDSDYFIEEE